MTNENLKIDLADPLDSTAETITLRLPKNEAEAITSYLNAMPLEKRQEMFNEIAGKYSKHSTV